MSRRRFIWQKAQAQSGLPEGYTAVEYIQTSGSQRIDTGVKSSASIGMSADFCLVDASIIQNLTTVYDPYKNYQLMVWRHPVMVRPMARYGLFAVMAQSNILKRLIQTDMYIISMRMGNTPSKWTVYSIKSRPVANNISGGYAKSVSFARNATFFDGYAYMKLYSCAIYDGGRKSAISSRVLMLMVFRAFMTLSAKQHFTIRVQALLHGGD